ncbi:glycine cleavage system protein H [Piscinibacter sakaiensis]|uniref:Glycine cleavage system H protein n=1 Tax=Piscinibacter sakaiensis TaxID=1547922 RepID=A0A0K8NTJ8_PISS1|nr:glycine cleavage system protein H [Piscinibacter sakaiensis]GAP33736.1 glycine cleavage system H protein [Piscinibacter sakaiensis]
MTTVAGHPFPEGLHYLVEHDVWAELADDGTARVGITAMGIALSGEVYMCRPKPVGLAIAQGRAIAVVELAKSIVSVKCPVGGTVVEVNEALADAPEWVHREPYGRGWIARLRLADWAADAPQLVHGAAVEPAMREHARLMQLA